MVVLINERATIIRGSKHFHQGGSRDRGYKGLCSCSFQQGMLLQPHKRARMLKIKTFHALNLDIWVSFYIKKILSNRLHFNIYEHDKVRA